MKLRMTQDGFEIGYANKYAIIQGDFGSRVTDQRVLRFLNIINGMEIGESKDVRISHSGHILPLERQDVKLFTINVSKRILGCHS